MIRTTAIILIGIATTLTGCKKEVASTESTLYGTWVKGANAGDTLQFMRKNNRNIMRYNASFNATMPAYSEVVFSFKQNQLSLTLFSPSTQDYYPVNSFKWKQAGTEFEIRGIELFTFLSSTQVHFTYRKI